MRTCFYHGISFTLTSELKLFSQLFMLIQDWCHLSGLLLVCQKCSKDIWDRNSILNTRYDNLIPKYCKIFQHILITIKFKIYFHQILCNSPYKFFLFTFAETIFHWFPFWSRNSWTLMFLLLVFGMTMILVLIMGTR